MTKSYTDIEQSKKLAEILPIESADHHYVRIVADFTGKPVDGKWSHPKYGTPNSKYANYIVQNFTTYEKIPCWSLAALLNALPVSVDEGRHCLALINSNPNGDIEWLCCYEDDNGNALMECYGDNQVDACVEMILKLHEQKLL